MNIRITLTDEAKRLHERVRSWPPRAFAAAARAMDEENEYTVVHIRDKYLSFPADGPTSAIGLRRKTGYLYRSLHRNDSQVTSDGIVSSIGSNLAYAAIHEFGGTTAPHDIRPKDKKALFFMIGERKVFAKVVHHPGSKFPARGYVQRGINDRLDDYSKSLSAAMIKAAEQN